MPTTCPSCNAPLTGPVCAPCAATSTMAPPPPTTGAPTPPPPPGHLPPPLLPTVPAVSEPQSPWAPGATTSLDSTVQPAQSPVLPAQSPWAEGSTIPLIVPSPAAPNTAGWSPEAGWVQPESNAPLQPPVVHQATAPLAAPGAPIGPPIFEQIAVTAEPAVAGRGGGRQLAVATAMLGIGAAAIVGFMFVTSGDDIAGGADSPEAAVTQMAEAISDGDALAAVGFLAPDELSGADEFVEKLIPYVSELSEEFADDNDSGETFELDVEAVDVEAARAGDHAAIVSFAIVGDVTIDAGNAQIFGAPYFGRVGGADGDFSTDFDSRDAVDGFDGSDLEVVVVELDGKWFISPFLSAGHAWVDSEGLPSGDYELVGEPRRGAASSPIAAVERYFEADEWSDAEDVAEVLGGGEGRFFDVFGDALDEAGLFGDEGIGEMFGARARYTLTEIGDGRVEVDDVDISFTDDSSGEFSIEFSDGCGTIEDDWSRVSGCFSELFPPDSDVDDRLWFQTVEEDGGHRVVMLPTVFDVLSRFVGPYDAETIRWATGSAHADDPQSAELGEQVDIDFDGRRYVVHEFDLDDGMEYSVEVDGDHEYEIFAGTGDGSFYETWTWDDTFESYGAEVARVVVFSEVATNCRGFECVPSGDGATSLTMTEREVTWDDVVDVEPADFDALDPQPVGDPRFTGPMVSTRIEIDGPATHTFSIPAGEFELGAFSWDGLDARIDVTGTACVDAGGVDLINYETCTFEHPGGQVDVVVEITGDVSVGSVSIDVRAIELNGLASQDQRVVALEVDGAASSSATVFDSVPAGGVLVVAAGADGQDITLTVQGDDTCIDKDYGLADGEVCYVEHAGGPLTVVVEGWSDADRTGTASVVLEVSR